MERKEALQLLSAPAPDDRLRAARFLSHHATEDDAVALQAALATETHKWVKSAINLALLSITPGPKVAPISAGAEDEDERLIAEIRAEAVEETAKQFVHELRPILGRLDVCAGSEIPDYQNSRTKIEWKRLQGFLTFIAGLGDAAASPTITEFDLATTIEGVTAAEEKGGIAIRCAGSKPHVIVSASDSIQVILSNALRNAIEATAEISSTEPVVVSWGTTDKEHWISVLDRGRGLPKIAEKIYEIGVTTKKGHMGVGLSLARQTANSLNGTIRLSPRDPLGTAFELRWPVSK